MTSGLNTRVPDNIKCECTVLLTYLPNKPFKFLTYLGGAMWVFLSIEKREGYMPFHPSTWGLHDFSSINMRITWLFIHQHESYMIISSSYGQLPLRLHLRKIPKIFLLINLFPYDYQKFIIILCQLYLIWININIMDDEKGAC
jgi:hypothetical protein